jgi:hypothetical protein
MFVAAFLLALLVVVVALPSLGLLAWHVVNRHVDRFIEVARAICEAGEAERDARRED